MKVKLLPKAARVLYAIADFVESKYTPGSGARFAFKFKASIDRLAIPNVEYTICSHPKLAALNYSRTHFNDWVIAFKINNKQLVVYEIIRQTATPPPHLNQTGLWAAHSLIIITLIPSQTASP